VSPTDERAWKRNEALLIAVLTGVLSLVAAAVGAYVGGRTANDGAKQIQEAEARREAAKETAAARASARLLIAELRDVGEYAQISLMNRPPHFAHSYPEALRVDLPRDDRTLLASRLSARAWTTVTTALVAASFVDSRARQFGVVADLDPEDVGVIRRRIARQFRSPVRESVRAFVAELPDQARAVRAGIAALEPLATSGTSRGRPVP
jgi:hypothetical protein